MSRQLKYRAWHKPTQLMDDVVLIDFYNEKIGILYADPVMQCESIQKYNLNEVELMQYTGLKDKKGKEIYEGDIVDGFAGEHYQGIWEYQNRFAIEFGWTQSMWDMLNCDRLEVIGNIYEDPNYRREK